MTQEDRSQSDNWEAYYARLIERPHRPILEPAAALVADKPNRVAIECGCGSGSDAAYLLAQGFTVHAFDAEAKSIEICQRRFADDARFQITQSSFETFEYPAADLIVAHFSLFFCPPKRFATAWQKIVAALPPGGVFSGQLLGLNDSWVGGSRWNVSAFSEAQVRALFEGFEIVRMDEVDEFGRTATGGEKHWHYYTIHAIKQD